MAELTKVKGGGPVVAKALAGMGIKTAKNLANASPDELVAVRGISLTGASVIIAAAGEIAGDGKKAAKAEKKAAKKAAKAAKKIAKAEKKAAKKAAEKKASKRASRESKAAA